MPCQAGTCGVQAPRRGPYLRLDASGMATVELGYLTQIVRRDDARDLMNHIASLNLMFRFP